MTWEGSRPLDMNLLFKKIDIYFYGKNWYDFYPVKMIGFANWLFIALCNWSHSQILECTCSIPHNTPFRTEMCTFLFWMEHCGIWYRCILGFVELVYYVLSNTVKDICDVYGLTNLIKTPTCHKGPVSTLIDIILVSNPKRYIDTLNAKFVLSDHHNIIGAATRRFAPSLKPHRIYYRSYKQFCEEKYLHDINCAPFHIADIFDDINDMAWFLSSPIRTIIDENAPIKSKIIKKKCVPYMNSKLRKAQFARNMSRNKFRRFGKSHWEENRKMRNYVVKIRKMSLKNYFTKQCEKQDKNFWHTVSPFMSDKKYRNCRNITLNENGETITDASRVSEIFNDFFCKCCHRHRF